jgi:hypothetical protein
MLLKHQTTSSLLTIVLLLVFITPVSIAGNYEKTYALQTQYGLFNQELYVSIPPSLYGYYGNMSHTINCDGDYARFVTPQAVEPIAASIKNVTRNLPYSDEQFVNAVLKLVHQIPYVISGTKYPVETLVDNLGDCVALSLLAASIMKAGGLDVVLIHYTGINPGHINVGVYLSYNPVYHPLFMTPTSFDYNNKTYWVAEATPGDWKVGDQSEFVANTKHVIIPLENTEQSSPAQVSSRLDIPLLPSSITVNLYQEPSSNEENTSAITISGSITPLYSGKNVAISINFNGSSRSRYDYFRTVTDDVGSYMLTWNLTSAGTYYITTSWSGTSNYAGADSETLTVFVGPKSFVQFENNGHNFLLEHANFDYYMFRSASMTRTLHSFQGVDNFLNIPLGAGVSLSYDFTILQTGNSVLNFSTKTIRVPASKQVIGIGRNQRVIIQIPSKTITVPDIPSDLKPIILPDDFNQTINNQFCFILQNNNENYSLNIRALNDYGLSNISQSNGSNTAFMNASESVKENTWYKVSASISGNGITANLYNTHGTLVESMVTHYNETNSNETIILITNNLDSAVVFKNLKIQTTNNSNQPPETNRKIPSENGLLVPYIGLSILLVATLAAIVYVKKKRQINDKKTRLHAISILAGRSRARALLISILL